MEGAMTFFVANLRLLICFHRPSEDAKLPLLKTNFVLISYFCRTSSTKETKSCSKTGFAQGLLSQHSLTPGLA